MKDYPVHEVMQMMLEDRATYSNESLIRAIREKFGANATFHSSTIEGMSAAWVVEFLHQRGNFIGDVGCFYLDPDHIKHHFNDQEMLEAGMLK